MPQEPGAAWGKPWGTKWLRLQGDVPESWGTGPDTTVEIVVDLGFTTETPGFQCEGIAWRPDGTIIKAISPRNQYIPLKLLGSGMAVDFYVEAAANPDVAQGWTFAATPYGDKATAGTAPQYRLGSIAIAELNQTVWELQQDIWTLAGLMHELPMEQPRRHEILRALERMMDVMDPDNVAGTAAAGREVLAEVLARPAYASAHQLVATGHAHIDSAWLWPVRETIRKCARTFSNVVALMDEDPDFVFSCSSAQQLAWMKEFYPELFGRIREKVKAGQFVPVGGMWVESDTNMPGGEAMARQFVEGKSFFLDEFGVECREAWLPDSFGYSAALPQIVKSAGSRWFLTQKISWNQVNRMPHHTFNWEGIDGTRLFTHFPPVDTYNSELSGRELAHAERNYRDHGRGTTSLVPFGYGDGGGGPTREMLAAAHRTADLEGSPKVRIGLRRKLLHPGRGGVHRPACVGGRDVPGTPPRHLHQPGPDQARQPPQRAPAPRGRTLVRHRRRPHRRVLRLPGRRAQAALAAGAAAAVPRHPAGQLHRLGPPGRRTELRRHQRGPRSPHRPGRGRRAGRGHAGVPAQRSAACPRRRPRAGCRRTGGSRPARPRLGAGRRLRAGQRRHPRRPGC